jgi:hypothetical protein
MFPRRELKIAICDDPHCAPLESIVSFDTLRFARLSGEGFGGDAEAE